MQLLILGKTPLISLAELESLFGSTELSVLSGDVAGYNSDTKIQIDRLGGVQKIAETLSTMQLVSWKEVRKYLGLNFKQLIKPVEGKKIKLGISVYGFSDVNVPEINATALSLKTALKQNGFSSRIIANKESALNAAQIKHGKLLSDSGVELVILKTEKEILIAKTTQIQDIDAYSKRDQARPNRDSTVGMLPPKLAQSIINISGAKSGERVLDPFCGTGVLLQEALLMGINIIGTDIEPRMIDYSRKNLEWLSTNFENINNLDIQLKIGDATSFSWPPFDTVACESYLGRPLSSSPDSHTLNKIIQDCNTIQLKFLKNIASRTSVGTRMCIAMPTWYTKNEFKHLPLLDSLADLGYNRISFVLTGKNKLIYHRKGQFVARELVVIERI